MPAGLLAPFVGVLGDRYRRELVLFVSALLRFVLCAAAAVGVWRDAPAELVYALAIVTSIANAPYKSAQAAIMPTLARTPSELTATNAVSSTVESLAFFLGPALAGVLLAVTGVDVVFAVAAAMFGVASLVILRMHVPRTEARRKSRRRRSSASAMAGFRVVFRHKELRVLMGLFTAQTLVAGLMLVFLVVVAIELLDMGESGVGYLNSAFGVGALVGAIGALGLTGARRLSPAFLVGLLLWGLPLAVLGLWSTVGIASCCSRSWAPATRSWTSPATRSCSAPSRTRCWLASSACSSSSCSCALGIGGVLAPVLSDFFGLENALIISGLFLPVLVLLFGRTVARIDAEAVAPETQELRLLTGVPIFAPLPGTAIEHIAGRLVPLRIEPGTVIVREGDAGDRFYVIVEGEVEVSGRGQADHDPGAGRVLRRDRAAEGRAAHGDGDGEDARRALRARAGGLPGDGDGPRAERAGGGDGHLLAAVGASGRDRPPISS